jgi:ABC-type uncharacterized transport system permease subunit
MDGTGGSVWGAIFTLAAVASALRVAIPYFLAALGAGCSERGGVINIGLEGMMLGGAFGYAVGAHYAANWGPYGAPLAGVAAGVLAGVALAALLGLATVYLRSEQIVSGLAINILAAGATRWLLREVFGSSSNSSQVASIRPMQVFAADSTFGPLNTLFHPLLWLAVALLFAVRFAIFETRFGLRLRAAGEHPLAADTLGVNVLRTRFLGVLASGALAGLAGVYLAADQGLFIDGMTAGRGYIALAVMIVGKWSPKGAFLAALAFGLAEAMADRLQIAGFLVGYKQVIQMVPYLLTLAALAGFIGGAKPPAAIGQPYVKERAR